MTEQNLDIVFDSDGTPLIVLDNKPTFKNVPFKITRIRFFDEDMSEILKDLASEFSQFWGEP